MSVKTQELENPERGMALRDRKKKKPALDDVELLERVAALRLLERPPDDAPHCGDCYRRGWRAALDAIRDGG